MASRCRRAIGDSRERGIVTTATLTDADVQNADVDARHITVTVSGDTAMLTGAVATWLQRDSVGRAAANAHGIASVDNRIVVQSFYDSKMDDWDEMC